MKVTYAINTRLAGGGIGNTAYHAVKAIYARGWLGQLLVSSTKTREFTQTDVRALGMAGRAMKRIANYDSSQRLYHWGDVLFDRWAAPQVAPCDIFHGWQNHVLASLTAAKKHGARTILERSNSHILQSKELLDEEYERWGWHEQSFPCETIERALREFDSADFIGVPSAYNLDSFLARGFDRSRMLLLPYGVDAERFRPAERTRTEPAPLRVIFVGQVTLRKGIQYLLGAWRKANLHNAELVVAGQVKPDARKVIAPYRIDSSIKWMDFVADPVSLYQASDVFVFPSIEEGSALVTYEAMACGLPGITTENSGSLVRDGIDGFNTAIRDDDAIAERLCWLYEHPSERLAMGRAARAAVEPMTWQRYGERLLDNYAQSLNQ